MKVLDFNIKAGFPLSETTLEFMQEMAKQLQQASLLGGTNYIVSGCPDNGATIGDGYVVVNGEVLPFVGGAKQPNVIVVDTATQKEFFGGAFNDYYHDRVATFGSADTEWPWEFFKRNDPSNGVLSRLDKIEKMLKPLIGYDVAGTTYYGSWLFWGRPASEIPEGWEAVPDADWKGKIPVVMNAADIDYDEVGEVGGSKTFSINQNNLPASLNLKVPVYNEGGNGAIASGGGGASEGTFNVPFVNTGGGVPLKHLLPYKVVMFIRFVG
jgi:hypothetical protein